MPSTSRADTCDARRVNYYSGINTQAIKAQLNAERGQPCPHEPLAPKPWRCWRSHAHADSAIRTSPSFGVPPSGLVITYITSRPAGILKGFGRSAQGCESASYPGLAQMDLSSTLKGLQHVPNFRRPPRGGCGAATPSGLGKLCARAPRVARASQPWAECSNPFRIERPLIENWVMTRTEVRAPFPF